MDKWSGYRFYSADQLPRLNRILALKDLGLTLDEIGRLLDDLPAAQIRGMLRLKQVQAQARVREEEERLARVEARLEQIEKEGKMPTYEVVLKSVPPLRVASVRGTVPTYSDQGMLWGELFAYLGRNGIRPSGPSMAIYHDPEYRERDVDAEVCEPVEATARGGLGTAPQGNERVKIYDLPAVPKMASLVHHGSYQTFNEAYSAIMEWIQRNGYRIVGPNREHYLQVGPNGEVRQDDPSYVTEIQLPVEKI